MTIDLTALFELCCDTRSDINGHLRYMHDVCIEIDAQVVLELGVRSGLSTVAFLHAMDRTNGHVWSVDIDRHHAPDEVRSHDRWTFTQADDLTVDPMPCDVLFIDTSHLYDHTLAELNRFASHARVVLLHDTQLERPAGAPADADVKKLLEKFWARDRVKNTFNYQALKFAPSRKGEFRTDGVPANSNTTVFPVQVTCEHVVEYNDGTTKAETKAQSFVFFKTEFGEWTFRFKGNN